MTSSEIRKKYLEFFEGKGHKVIPSASLVPENDPTTLFTGSGMQPMVPYLLGEKNPLGTKITDSQKCFRTVDIEEVGDNRHTTFFEMLGNWSLGDYFKKEQIPWMFEFLTEVIGIDPNKLYVTTFIGDEKNNIPKDTESARIWKNLFKSKNIKAKEVEIGSEENGNVVGMQGGRIFYYDASKNWWSRTGIPENMPAGEPGGPDSEMFYDFGIPHNPKFGKECHPNCDCGRFLEIGNNVFMEYKKTPDGTFSKLPQQNVDFGGGLERIAMAVENCPDVIEVNHKPILDYLEKVSGKVYGKNEEETKSFRIISDHIKASVFLIGDGVIPSNTDQGYYVRRLIRRAVRYWDKLAIKESGLSILVDSVLESYKNAYPETYSKKEEIKEEIKNEEEKFRKTLEKGLKKFENSASISVGGLQTKILQPHIVFELVTSDGFPFELIKELAKERGLMIDEFLFEQDMQKHKALSRAGSDQKFKGGLGGTGEMETKYHTATHLLRQALEIVLGEKIMQKGSNITAERLRFDFNHDTKLTDEEKQKVEDLVNQKISENLPVNKVVMKREEADKTGAAHVFGEKYGDEVSVYIIGPNPSNPSGSPFSQEFCGGPHVSNTSELGKFKIIKEESVSSGIRRIKAILE